MDYDQHFNQNTTIIGVQESNEFSNDNAPNNKHSSQKQVYTPVIQPEQNTYDANLSETEADNIVPKKIINQDVPSDQPNQNRSGWKKVAGVVVLGGAAIGGLAFIEEESTDDEEDEEERHERKAKKKKHSHDEERHHKKKHEESEHHAEKQKKKKKKKKHLHEEEDEESLSYLQKLFSED